MKKEEIIKLKINKIQMESNVESNFLIAFIIIFLTIGLFAMNLLDEFAISKTLDYFALIIIILFVYSLFIQTKKLKEINKLYQELGIK